MSDQAEKLARRLEREGQKLSQFFSELPEDLWHQTLYTDGAHWQVQQVLAHLVDAEASLPRLFKNIAEGGGGVAQDFDINEYNENAVQDLEALPPARLVAMFSERSLQTIAFVRSLTDEDLDKVGNHPWLGQAPLKEMIRLFYLHYQLHLRDVRSLYDERNKS